MSGDSNMAALAAILDALTMVQGQLDTLARSNARIETAQADILARLDTIDAGQAAVTDLVPVLETILARSIEDRDIIRSQFTTVATVAGFAHAAARGNGAPLPNSVADDPLLDQFALMQPADLAGRERALVDWRAAAGKVALDELTAILSLQVQPSPTDTADARVLRFRLAAITRAEIEGRGGRAPPVPSSTIARDSSIVARQAQSTRLARLWRSGESPTLFAEPELAGALDIFVQIERDGVGRSEAQLAGELAELHHELGQRIEAGERPSLADQDPLAEHDNRHDQSRTDRPER